MDTTKAHKAVKAARLAMSEWSLGNEDAALHAGTTAGKLWADAGTSSANTLSDEVPGLCACPVWNNVVDGWYDSQPKAVSEAEVDAVMAHLRRGADVHGKACSDVVARMWAELQRRRGL